MTATETVTFVIGIVMCIVGVLTFIGSLVKGARNDGILANKVDTALAGIEEIKKTLSEQRTWRETMGQKVEAHEQQIKTLFRRVETLEETCDGKCERCDR